MKKTPEQIQAEAESVQSFLQSVIKELKGQIADISHELAVQRVMNDNNGRVIEGKDSNIKELTSKIEELEEKIKTKVE